MNVRKFTANTSREAIRMLRDALGSDAVILSNRVVDGRVEITKGLKQGDRVATAGLFTLKSLALKSTFGEED